MDIFRPAQDVPPIVEQAIQLRKKYGIPYVIWMQLGVVNEEAAERARGEGLTVVMNRCMMIERRRLEKEYDEAREQPGVKRKPCDVRRK